MMPCIERAIADGLELVSKTAPYPAGAGRPGSSAPATGSIAEPAAVLAVGAAAGLGIIARGDRGVPPGTLPRRVLSIARSELDLELVELVPLGVGSLPLRYGEQLLQALAGGNGLRLVHAGIIPSLQKTPREAGSGHLGPPDKAGWVRSIRQLQEHFAVFDFHRKRAGAAGVRRFGAAIFEADDPAVQRAGHSAPEHDSLRQGTAFVRAAIEQGEALAFGVAEHYDVAGRAADDAGAELGDVLEPAGLDPACDARRIARFRKRLRHQAGSASVSY